MYVARQKKENKKIKLNKVIPRVCELLVNVSVKNIERTGDSNIR